MYIIKVYHKRRAWIHKRLYTYLIDTAIMILVYQLEIASIAHNNVSEGSVLIIDPYQIIAADLYAVAID